jgi:hypothetical protein
MGLQDPNLQAGHQQPPTNDSNETDSGRDSGNESEKMNDAADVEMGTRQRIIPAMPDSNLKDKYIVDWEGIDDPACPRNWPGHLKWANLAVVALLALLT